jgi:superfamily II DNA or RNA helicase
MIVIAHNATTAKIVNASKDALLEVNRLLSYRVDGAEHMASFVGNAGSWNGRSSFFSWSDGRLEGTFAAGFVRHVADGLKAKGHQVIVKRKPLPEPLGPARPAVDAFGYADRYDYQPKTMDLLCQLGAMTARVATGGGKSRIARMCYRRIARPTLFLTTRGILMHQMKDAVEEMGEEVAVFGDGEWGVPYTKPDGREGRRITQFCVGMVQTLAQRLEITSVDAEFHSLQLRRARELEKLLEDYKATLKTNKTPLTERGKLVTDFIDRFEKQFDEAADRAKLAVKVAKHERMRLATIDILGRFEFVIAEEAHEVSGQSFFKVMQTCKNAAYRLALTGTPFMKDSEEANLMLLAAVGPVAIHISEELLISRGILARPYFKFLKIGEEHRPEKLARSTPYQQAVTRGIVNFEYRNKVLVAELLRARRYGLNGMILVQRKDHGDILAKMLRAAGARVLFIQGEDNQKERKAALAALGTGEIDFLIGTTILDVGVDVPSVGIIVLAGGGKAEVALRQRIGRGLREKKKGPNVAFIIDVYDELNNHLQAHAGERQQIIKTTPGFAENIVRDFDYQALGFVRASAEKMAA